MPIRAVLFDLDGTLIETHIDFAAMKREMLAMAGSVGVSPSAIADRDILGIVDAAADHLASGGGDATGLRRQSLSILEGMEVTGCANPVLLPGTLPLLHGLTERGLKIGVVTRNCRRVAAGLLARFDVPFDALLTRDDVRQVKPDPQHLWEALAVLRCPPGEAAMVGDHWMDIQAGRRAGVAKTVGVLGSRPPDWFAPCPPDATVRDLSEAKELLAGC